MMTAILGLAAMVALIALFAIFVYWYFRQVRDGRIDLYTDPEWTSVTGPASPHSLPDPETSFGTHAEYDDDHTLHLPEE
jgi:hypothetical protein